MKQIWITRKGPPEVLQIKDCADPIPSPNEVLISVRASGINFSDILARRGRYPEAPNPPVVVGYEVSGTVQAVGSNVSEFEIGQKVLAPVFFGGIRRAAWFPRSRFFLCLRG
jgi:NADPH:quinone reductase-like Zn-dependent oxidoreductase